MENKKITPHDILRLFIQADRLHRNLAEIRMARLNIHRSQHMMLLCISSFSEPPTQKEISKKLDITAATAAVTLKKLEEHGYITKVTSEGDGRCNKVSITEKGKNILSEGKKIVNEIDKATIEGLSHKELELFSECLIKIQNNLKNHGAELPCGKFPDKQERRGVK
jgi:DNA-binding MarR family transcriptional regulator